MLDWTIIADHKSYNQQRFDLLYLLEGSTTRPYLDSVGDPTIGIGFDLVYNLEPVLRAIVGKRNWSDTLLARLETEVDKNYATGQDRTLIANLDRVMADWHQTRDSDVPSAFRFRNDAQIGRALDALAPQYDRVIDNWISGIPESSERAALFSLAWNNPSLLGPKLKAAVLSGDRAEAWYEIRYNSNGGASASDGIANRRYVEADQFDLYHGESRATYAEAVDAGRMLAAHHQPLLAYEARYDPLSAAAIKGIETIGTIEAELQPAISAVLKKYDLPSNRHFEELLAAGDGIANLAGDGTGYDSKSNNDDILLGDAAGNHLSGGGGRDLLIGLKGVDRLTGNAGADLFVFAAAKDSPISGKADLITDFKTGIDHIVLGSASTDFHFLSGRNDVFSGSESEIRWFWSGGKTMIEADYNGDGHADLGIALTGRMNLSEGDFLL